MLNCEELLRANKNGEFIYLNNNPFAVRVYYHKSINEFTIICKSLEKARSVYDVMIEAAKGAEEIFPIYANFYRGSAEIEDSKVSLRMSADTSPARVLAILLSKGIISEPDALNIDGYLLNNPSGGTGNRKCAAASR